MLSWIFLLLAGCNADGGISASFSSPGKASFVSHASVTIEEKSMKLLEDKIANLELLVASLIHSDKIDNTISIPYPRDIDEDVQQNKEDIIDLRLTDGRHDMLISHAMTDTKYINTTIIPELRHDMDLHNDYVDETRPPIGSIVAWMPGFSRIKELPSGWQRCDGSLIKTGTLKGQVTPDLNTIGRFMRGSTDEMAGVTQEDAVQDHTHVDEGHTHQDSGHTHTDTGHAHYEDSSGNGHYSPFLGSDEANAKDVICTRSYNHDFFGGDCGGYFLKKDEVWVTEGASAKLTTNPANIQSSNSGISGMASGRLADETRPKSMNVVYIIRVN